MAGLSQDRGLEVVDVVIGTNKTAVPPRKLMVDHGDQPWPVKACRVLERVVIGKLGIRELVAPPSTDNGTIHIQA